MDTQIYYSVLKGVMDIHVHVGPDAFRSRMYDDISIVKEGIRHGVRAIMFKSHEVCTADRAIVANRLYGDKICILGGLALNQWCGGLNPYAVEMAIGFKANMIWLPTLSSALDCKAFGKPGGIQLVENHRVVPALDDILRLIAQSETATLGCGHCSAEEALVVVERARELGVSQIIINHPALYRMQYTLEQQERLLQYGVFFERCYGATQRPLSPKYHVSVDDNIQAIRALGVESTIVATDLGGSNDKPWADGLADYIHRLYAAGFSDEEVRKMTQENPAKALRLTF